MIKGICSIQYRQSNRIPLQLTIRRNGWIKNWHAAKQIDATIGYSAELNFYIKGTVNDEPLVSLPINENPNLLYAYIVIPKTTWRRNLKNRIDQILLRIRKTKQYKDIIYDWFGMEPVLKKAIDECFDSDIC